MQGFSRAGPFAGYKEDEWGEYVSLELRVQVSATRFRVPDVCVTDAREEVEQIPPATAAALH